MRRMHFTASLKPGRIAWDKDSLMYNKQARAEDEADNCYRDIDNFAYHKSRIQ